MNWLHNGQLTVLPEKKKIKISEGESVMLQLNVYSLMCIIFFLLSSLLLYLTPLG